jgi:RNA polymerase sigma-70 factor (ECF subfamily)
MFGLVDGTNQTDAGLVARFQGGDDPAFDELVSRHQRKVLDFAYRMIGDAAEAQDVAQETFVRAYRALPDYRPGAAAFTTWLFQIARRLALDRLRARSRRPVFQSLEDLPAPPPSPGKDPAQAFQALETGEQIARAVAGLPEDQRAALVLAEYEDLSMAEIAAALGTTEKAVENRLYRARTFLRERLRHLLDR